MPLRETQKAVISDIINGNISTIKEIVPSIAPAISTLIAGETVRSSFETRYCSVLRAMADQPGCGNAADAATALLQLYDLYHQYSPTLEALNLGNYGVAIPENSSAKEMYGTDVANLTKAKIAELLPPPSRSLSPEVRK